MPNRIDSVHVSGFRSLADVRLDGLSGAAVLIGANGSGKSNFIRFFEMLSWMLRARRLGLDEPELGLHPAAVALVGGMIKALSVDRQVIVATQSPLLVDTFSLDEIVVLELRDGRTEVRRPDEREYRRWLEEYSTGELWQKNLLGGRP